MLKPCARCLVLEALVQLSPDSPQRKRGALLQKAMVLHHQLLFASPALLCPQTPRFFLQVLPERCTPVLPGPTAPGRRASFCPRGPSLLLVTWFLALAAHMPPLLPPPRPAQSSGKRLQPHSPCLCFLPSRTGDCASLPRPLSTLPARE